jgi:hypothetical protein
LAANPWVQLGSPGNGLVAYFFNQGSPFLTAGSPPPPNVSNKVLWVEDQPTGGDLRIVATPPDGAKPTVRFTVPSAGSPAGAYPSILSLPTPGCWNLAVTWATGDDSIGLIVGGSS